MFKLFYMFCPLRDGHFLTIEKKGSGGYCKMAKTGLVLALKVPHPNKFFRQAGHLRLYGERGWRGGNLPEEPGVL